jgi:ABC-type branched-subunit amino acid transport system ATPase component
MASGRLIAEGVEHEILQNPDVMEVYLSAERQES